MTDIEKNAITNIKLLKARKKSAGLTSQQISDESGVPLSTVQKIFAGQTKSPRFETLLKINKVIEKHETPTYNGIRFDNDYSHVAEDNLALDLYYYNSMQKSSEHNSDVSDDVTRSFWKLYTIDDYYAMPKDRHVELIDGRIYDMTAPVIRHQDIILRVAVEFFSYIENSEHDCRVIMSPVDVRLDRDDYTMVEPDLIVICKHDEDDDRLSDIKRVEGAPDFVMEVLSPSTVSRDVGLKYRKYKKAEVREYWYVDPGRQTVTVCDFEHDFEKEYTFDDTIPVNLTGGELSIDFTKVKAYML